MVKIEIRRFDEYLNEAATTGKYRTNVKERLRDFMRDKNWFLYRDGLNLRKIIDEHLSPIYVLIDGNKDRKYHYPLSLLYKTNNNKGIIKRGDSYYCPDLKANLIMVNGEWSYLNKLNTNINALIELLSDFFEFLYIKYIPEEGADSDFNDDIWLDGKKIPDYYINGLLDILEMDDDDFKEMVMDYVLFNDENYGINLKSYLNLKFKNLTDLNIYTNRIRINSEKGERAEIIASDFLKKKGSVILYRGGDGDLIDMKFNCDIIIEKDGVILTVQVKSYALDENDFKNNSQYDNLDVIIGVGENNKITLLYDKKIYTYG